MDSGLADDWALSDMLKTPRFVPQVLVHSPYDFPEVGGKGFAIAEGTESFIGVTAQRTERFACLLFPSLLNVLISACFPESSSEVTGMTVERRRCVKKDEVPEVLADNGIVMEAYKFYSRKSCLMECRAREFRDLCGCLPYYFPDFSPIWNRNVTCNTEGLQCLARIASRDGPMALMD